VLIVLCIYWVQSRNFVLEFEIRIIILYCPNSLYYLFYNLFHILITEECNVLVKAMSSVAKILYYVFLISPMHLKFQCGWLMVILYIYTHTSAQPVM